jgi:hypothetical protein
MKLPFLNNYVLGGCWRPYVFGRPLTMLLVMYLQTYYRLQMGWMQIGYSSLNNSCAMRQPNCKRGFEKDR